MADAQSTRGASGLVTREFNGMHYTVGAQYADQVDGFLRDLAATGYNIKSIGGHNNRPIAGTNTPSIHAFGAAIDINPSDNPLNGGNNLPPNIREIAAAHGMGWGGAWTGKKDPMHFSFDRSEGGAYDVLRPVSTAAGSQPRGTVNNVAERRPMPWEEPYDRANPPHSGKMPWEDEPHGSSTPTRDFLEMLKEGSQPKVEPAVQPAPAQPPAQPAPVTTQPTPAQPAPVTTPPPATTQPAVQPASTIQPSPDAPTMATRGGGVADLQSSAPAGQQPPTPAAQYVNPLQALITGGANGALFGYGPQVVGAVQSINPLTRETYQEARDRALARIEQAQKQQPYAYAAGDLAGNVLTAAVPFAGEGAIAGKLAGAGVRYMPTTVARGLIGGTEGALNAGSDPNATLGSVATGAATGAAGSALAPPFIAKAGEGVDWVLDKTTGRLMRFVGGGERNAGVAAALGGAGAGEAAASGILGAVPYVGTALDATLGGPVGQGLAHALVAPAVTDVGGRLIAGGLRGAETATGRGTINALTGQGPQQMNMLQNQTRKPQEKSSPLDEVYDPNLAIAAKKLFTGSARVDASDLATLLKNASPHDEIMIRKAFSDSIDHSVGGSP